MKIKAIRDLRVEDFINKIICDDSLSFLRRLPDKSVNLVLTDPPYGLGKNAGTRNKNDYDGFEDTPEYYKTVVVEIIKECIRVAERVVLTPGNRNFNFLPQPDDFGTFYQPATMGLSRWGRADAQPIFYYGKSPHRNITQFNSRQVTEPASCSEHSCAKPLKAWTWLLEKSSRKNDVVLDPFAGSGTTAVACLKTDRKYIMIEQSEKYCDVAKGRVQIEFNRLSNNCYVNDLELFKND